MYDAAGMMRHHSGHTLPIPVPMVDIIIAIRRLSSRDVPSCTVPLDLLHSGQPGCLSVLFLTTMVPVLASTIAYIHDAREGMRGLPTRRCGILLGARIADALGPVAQHTRCCRHSN